MCFNATMLLGEARLAESPQGFPIPRDFDEPGFTP
jgi:hypothetical protein